MEAEDVIRLLGLQQHPREGGWFKETYRSPEKYAGSELPVRYGAERAFATLIFYLITPERFSTFHRVKSDEIFHYYLGGPSILTILSPEGNLTDVVLGPDLVAGNVLQAVVPRGHWQAVRIKPGQKWSLLGAGVSPGFEYADFEEAARCELVEQYPQHQEVIRALTSA